MRSRTRYVRPDEVLSRKPLLANFRRFRRLVDRCVALSLKIADRQTALLRYATPTSHNLPLLLFSAAALSFMQGQWSPPTVLGFAVFRGDLILAAAQPPDVSASPLPTPVASAPFAAGAGSGRVWRTQAARVSS